VMSGCSTQLNFSNGRLLPRGRTRLLSLRPSHYLIEPMRPIKGLVSQRLLLALSLTLSVQFWQTSSSIAISRQVASPKTNSSLSNWPAMFCQEQIATMSVPTRLWAPDFLPLVRNFTRLRVRSTRSRPCAEKMSIAVSRFHRVSAQGPKGLMTGE